MSTHPVAAATPNRQIMLRRIGRFPNLRVLAWSGENLYASSGYSLLRANFGARSAADNIRWQTVANYHPAWWRKLTSFQRLTSRLFRDGFHALAIISNTSRSSTAIIAVVPGAIVTLAGNETEFRLTHRILHGTRPLHITALPNRTVLWGEYFDNTARDEVHIYASTDFGASWNIAYTFPRGGIRHIHNIVYDRWQDCLWILTGDYGDECRILRASCDLKTVDVALRGNQQARTVALIPTQDGVYFSSDTPLEKNFIFHMERSGTLSKLVQISSSSICGCRINDSLFFSTMAEPSKCNSDHEVRVYGGNNGERWSSLLSWTKDRWPMRWFQYGNAFLPDGDNSTNILAVTTVAVDKDDMVTSLYAVLA